MINELPTATKRVLKNQGITALNAMQQASMAAHESEKNILLLSPTGSGKTLAFLLPLIGRIDAALPVSQAMIIAPTRELAIQIEDVFRTLKSRMKVLCCYGGNSMRDEKKILEQKPQLIIGTPGRIEDHMKREHIEKNAIESLIIDEFDKVLAFGFQKEMKGIVKNLPNLKYKTLTSATYAEEIPDFLKFNQKEVLDFLDIQSVESHLEIYKVNSPYSDKLQSLFSLLCYLQKGSSIVFCNHRESVERIHEFLSSNKIVSASYHGKLDQKERESNLTKFRNGSIDILIATDLAARGVDIVEIDHIIHYHLPIDEESYIHRNGRTARMQTEGKIYILQSEKEELPEFIPKGLVEIKLKEKYALPPEPEWTTLYFGSGRKEKINKGDIVGFLSKTADLLKGDVGSISLKDHFAYVAVKRAIYPKILHRIEGKKIKNQKVKIKLAD